MKPWHAILALILSAAYAFAADPPIRVLIFQTCGQSGYIHAAIGSGSPRLATILKDPVAAKLGNPPVAVPPGGFTTDILGPAAGSNGTTDDGHALIAALATHDVLVLNSNTAIGNLFTTTDRLALLAWIAKHGVVGFHGAADSHSLWPSWDSLTAGLFTTHDVAIAHIALDSTPASTGDAIYKELIQGLSKDSTFNEEWYSYQSNPRNAPGVHVLATLDEKTYTPTSKMGDHPISWYRTSPQGGRFFYTGGGHMQELFSDNRWFRRQAYNAILWAGNAGTVSVHETGPSPAEGGASAQGGKASIVVAFSNTGAHSVEIAELNGRRVAQQRGNGMQTHTFANLKANTLYAVITTSQHGRSSRLIKTE